MRTLRSFTRLAAGALLLLGVPIGVGADAGADGTLADGLAARPKVPHELLSIIDDSEPVGIGRRQPPPLGDDRLVFRPHDAIVDDGEPEGPIHRRKVPAGHDRSVIRPHRERSDSGRMTSLYHPPSERFLVAWTRRSPAGYDVVVSGALDEIGSRPRVLAEAATTTAPPDPVLVLDPQSHAVHLLYWSDDAWPRVMSRTASADLSSWSDPVQVSRPGEMALRPAGVFHRGVLHVVYEVHTSRLGGTPRQIVLAWQDEGAFSSEVVATTGHAGPNMPQVYCAAGTITVAWIDEPGTVAWTRRQADGPWERVSTAPLADQR
jgi:hypothetical protein